MTHESGRVTILPEQIRRLAALSTESPGAIEIIQTGSVLRFNNGVSNFSVDANGHDIHPTNQEQLSC